WAGERGLRAPRAQPALRLEERVQPSPSALVRPREHLLRPAGQASRLLERGEHAHHEYAVEEVGGARVPRSPPARVPLDPRAKESRRLAAPQVVVEREVERLAGVVGDLALRLRGGSERVRLPPSPPPSPPPAEAHR